MEKAIPASHVQASLADMLNDCSIDRVMALDNDWNIIAWNKTSELITGIKRLEIYGQKLLDVFPDYASDREMMSAMELAFSGIKSFVPSHKDLFNRKHYENHFIPLRDEQGALVGVMNIMHDVAHRIKAEQQLYKLNQKLNKKYKQLENATNELATFTYIATHNLKEPLRQVYSSIELLIRAEAKMLSDGGKANLRRMQGSLNRMNLLLDDIAALSRISSTANEGEVIDFNEVLSGVINEMAKRLESVSGRVAAASLSVVQGHREMLSYLCHYLLSNAIRFRHADRDLTVQVTAETVQVAAASYIRITFADNGIGFDPADAERIFMMADRTPNNQGVAGAGLAICHKIMTAHEGFIQAEAWPGKGAAFHCFFPAGMD